MPWAAFGDPGTRQVVAGRHGDGRSRPQRATLTWQAWQSDQAPLCLWVHRDGVPTTEQDLLRQRPLVPMALGVGQLAPDMVERPSGEDRADPRRSEEKNS